MKLIPMLPVQHLSASVSFYEKLGFTVTRREDHWGWARLGHGDCEIMLDQSINQQPSAPRQSVVYLYPDNIDEYHGQVRVSGLEISDLETTFYGMREFRINDPDGNRLWIGQAATPNR